MARAPKTELKVRLISRYTELRNLNPIGVNHIAVLATEFGLSQQTIRYHLGDTSKDARNRYTPTERAMLRTMSRAEIALWAKANGRNPDSVYAAALRIRHKADGATPERPSALADRKSAASERGFLDFSDRNDLAAFGIPVEAFKKAQDDLKSLFPAASTISLLAPNYLYHNATHRHYVLSIGEQVSLLDNAKAFIRTRATAIAAGWLGGAGTKYYVLLKNSYGDEMRVDESDDLEHANRLASALRRVLRTSEVTISIADIPKIVYGSVSPVKLAPALSLTTPTPPDVDKELEDCLNLSEPGPPGRRISDEPLKSPTPKVYRDLTGRADPNMQYTFRCSSEKAPTTLTSPTLDDAAAYYSKFAVDTLNELLTLVEEEGKWLIVYDSNHQVVARSANAPE